jgi:hypothetical protein
MKVWSYTAQNPPLKVPYTYVARRPEAAKLPTLHFSDFLILEQKMAILTCFLYTNQFYIVKDQAKRNQFGSTARFCVSKNAFWHFITFFQRVTTSSTT